MSRITTVVLICGGEVGPIETINSWLHSNKFWPLKKLNPSFGGTKFPMFDAYGSAYNHLPFEDFRAVVLSQNWEYAEDVVLIVRNEDNPITTYRPVVAAETEIRA